MANKNIRCNALISDLNKQITSRQRVLSNINNPDEYTRLSNEIVQLRRLVLTLKNCPDRLSDTYLRCK